MTDTLDAPGVYDLPAAVYLADPVTGGSLSSSGARRLLPPSCPALFHHWSTAGQEHKNTFDVGHAAHALVLGVGAPFEVIDAGDYKTKSAREQRDAAYEDGLIPLLVTEHEQVQAMATALRRHPVAPLLFNPASGKAEQTLIWVDEETGVWCRAMLDWLPNSTGSRLLVTDYKTTKSAAPDSISKSLNEYRYFQQAAWYLDGVEALGLTTGLTPAFLFVFQEKTPPYLVTVGQVFPETIQWGRVLNRKALDVYRRCTSTGQWPGYTDEVISLSLPRWAERRLEAWWEAGAFDVLTEATP